MAWDDNKDSGDLIRSNEWDTMVSDQKGHASRHEPSGTDALDFSLVNITNLDGSSGSSGEFLTTDGSSLSFAVPPEGMTSTERQAFNDVVAQLGRNDFADNLEELGYDGGFFDIFRDTSKIPVVDKPYQVSEAEFVDDFDLSTQDNNVLGADWADNGNKFYIAGDGSTSVYEYNAGTPYDVSTLSFVQGLDVSADSSRVYDVSVKNEGSKLYVVEGDTGIVNEYNLSTAFDISTASFNQSKDFSSQTGSPDGIDWNDDGTKLYLIDLGSIYEYDLSTAFDISTASFNQSKDITANSDSSLDISWSDDGSKMLVVDAQEPKEIDLYKASTSFDLSTLSYDSTLTLDASLDYVNDVSTNGNGSKIFVTGRENTVREYKLEGLDAENVTVSTLDGGDQNGVIKLDLTTYTLQELTYSNNFIDVSSRNNLPTGVEMNPEGSKVFVTDFGSNRVDEYLLSTNFDLSTGSYNQSLDISGEETNCRGIDFNSDGTKLYIIGIENDEINSYNLSTAYDIGTATFNTNFSVAGESTFPESLVWNNDGTKVFVLDDDTTAVYSYAASTAFDISSLSYTGNSYSFSEFTEPTGLDFNKEGDRMVVSNTSDNTLYEYELSTGFDLSSSVSFTETTKDLSSESSEVDAFKWVNKGIDAIIADGTNDAEAVQQYEITDTVENGFIRSIEFDLADDGFNSAPSTVVVSQSLIDALDTGEDVQFVIEDTVNNTSNTITQSDVDTEFELTNIDSRQVQIKTELTSDGSSTPVLDDEMFHFQE